MVLWRLPLRTNYPLLTNDQGINSPSQEGHCPQVVVATLTKIQRWMKWGDLCNFIVAHIASAPSIPVQGHVWVSVRRDPELRGATDQYHSLKLRWETNRMCVQVNAEWMILIFYISYLLSHQSETDVSSNGGEGCGGSVTCYIIPSLLVSIQ